MSQQPEGQEDNKLADQASKLLESTKQLSSQHQDNYLEDDQPLEEVKPSGRFGIRRVTEQEANRIKGQRGIEAQR